MIHRTEKSAGFTMVELLVVVGIIAMMGAVALPSLLAFIRNYTIEGAAKGLASEIQSARYKAISRNVNLGVLMLVMDDRSYRWVIEDDVSPQNGDDWTVTQTIAQLAVAGREEQWGALRSLPSGVLFVATGATDVGFRYNRYGGWCQPGVDTECPAIAGGSIVNYVVNTASGAAIQLSQASTGLKRVVRVGTGGRVVIEPF